MAILNDLTRETSFRRFYLRWLVATWLPAIGTAAIWALLSYSMAEVGLGSLQLVPPIDLWGLIAFGQWWFLRRYSRSSGLYALLTFLGGMVGTLAWLATRDDGLSVYIGLLSVISDVLSYLIFGFDHSSFLAVVGKFLFGAAIGCCQARLMAPGRADRGMWIMFNGGLATAILLFLFPYAMIRLNDIRLDIMRPDDDLFEAAVNLPTAPVALCAVWLAYSSAAGLFLWALRWRQVRRDGAGMVQVFD
jgi:hypothetical protein